MDRFFGLVGVAFILALAFLMSNNKKRINWRLVISGLILQSSLALFVLKTPQGKWLFEQIGHSIEKVLQFSMEGGKFVFGVLVDRPEVLQKVLGGSWIFALQIMPTIIFVAVLVSIAYHIGLMQKLVSVVAKIAYRS